VKALFFFIYLLFAGSAVINEQHPNGHDSEQHSPPALSRSFSSGSKMFPGPTELGVCAATPSSVSVNTSIGTLTNSTTGMGGNITLESDAAANAVTITSTALTLVSNSSSAGYRSGSAGAVSDTTDLNHTPPFAEGMPSVSSGLHLRV
jgi:hypothetical protein